MRYRKLSDRALLRAVAALVTRDRVTTAELLKRLAEVDERRLYLGLGHGSMFAYCTEALHMSESEAGRRIHAARAVRRFPALLVPVADGRVHLSALCLLAPYLTKDNLAELVAAATHRCKDELESWLSARFAPPLLLAAARSSAPSEVAAAPAVATVPAPTEGGDEHLLGDVVAAAGAPTGPMAALPASSSAPMVTPHFVLHVPIAPATHQKLQHAQRLLAHTLPAGDVAAVIDRALDLLIERVERRKLAAVKKPRPARLTGRPLAPRTIPAAVKRVVVARDGERCAFVAPGGRRCSARSRLEFDHLDPVARGGLASAGRIRLLCRAHNQFEAERVFGKEFMQAKWRRERERAESPPSPPDPTG